MIELLALPGWRTPATTLDAWAAELTTHAGPVVVRREENRASWLEVSRLRLRGYALLAGPVVEAINFELNDPDPEPATRALNAAAEALGWEIHHDDEDVEEDDEAGGDDDGE